MKRAFISCAAVIALASPALRAADLAALPMPSAASTRTPVERSSDVILEEGKTLFARGQYMAALSRFMTVLRREPQQPEARQYLREVIELLKKSPGIAAQPGMPGQPGSQGLSTEAYQQQLRQRSLLLQDIKAIPGVVVHMADNMEQIELDTSLLFEESKSGLLEEGIPVLDRISAWLKTFEQQPVIIHCDPEELQDPQKTGDLFLHRYAALYGFFVEERRMPPTRFVSADLLLPETTHPSPAADAPHRIVIETFGNPTMDMRLLPAEPPQAVATRWLELSIMASRTVFNPEEGESISLDIAALTKSGLRSWVFKIVPVTPAGSAPVFSLAGKGNVLKRVLWYGLDTKTGSFVKAGSYVSRLVGTDTDGFNMNRELMVQIQRTTLEAAPVRKPPVRKVHHRALKPAVKPAPATEATVPSGTPPPAAPVVEKPAAEAKPPEAPAAEPPAEDTAVRTIWKQVLQFDPNQSDLKPALKSSLERIAKTLEVYPLQKVRIMGFADASEQDASLLARQRAERVRDTLVHELKVDAKRVSVAGGQVLSGAVESGTRKVEMSIVN